MLVYKIDVLEMLKEHGYNNSYAIKRITGVIIEKVGHGKYKMLIDIPS